MTLSLTLGGSPVIGYSNLQFTSVARGGFASASFNMTRKLDKSLLTAFTDVMIYDTATGEQAGGGRLMEQGRNSDGSWEIVVLGEGLASTQDVTAPLFYIDQTIGNWYKKERTHRRQDVTITQYPSQTDDDSVMVWQATEDKAVNTGAYVTMLHPVAELCRQQVGGIGLRHKSGVINGSMRVRSYVGSIASPYTDLILSEAFDTTISTRAVVTRNGGWGADRSAVSVQFYCNAAVTGASVVETYWSAVRDLTVRAQIFGADGVARTTGYTNEYILGSEVFTDLIVRRCPRLKVGTVATTAHQFDQMTYLDGINAYDVLEDVLAVEQAYSWDVYEQDIDGKWAANYRPQPTQIRYEISVEDGFTAPSPTTEIYNRVTVVGKTPGGRDVNVMRSRSVPALDDAGVIRHATIPFGGELWSVAAAQKAGDDYLAAHSVAPNAGTLVVGQAVKDNFTGRKVEPYMIRPNELVLVRGVQPSPDVFNAAAPDGATVFYIESMTYTADNSAAVLELDSYTLDEFEAISQLNKRGRKR